MSRRPLTATKTITLLRRPRVLLRIWRSRWRRLSLQTLRLFVRFVPSERQRVFALTLLIGVLCGLAAVAFHLAILQAEHLLIQRAITAPSPFWIGLTILTPTLGGLVVGVLLYYGVPDARGSGIPQVKVAYVVHGGQLPFRVVLGKFVLSTIQIGAGASLGRQGPTVQICAGIASLLGRITALSRRNQKRLLPVGIAAGIAAAFNAPLAAVTFTIEEIVGDLDQTVLSGVIVAAAVAAVVAHTLLGVHPFFDIPHGYGLHHYSSLLLYVVLGIAAALVSVLFCESLLKLRKQFQRLALIPVWARPAVGGCVTGILAVVALLWLQTDGITGGGYRTLSAALDGQLAVRVLLALCVLKIAATVFSYSSGGAGGLFAPALFIGAMLGGAIGFLDVAIFDHDHVEIGAFALVGMGAVFAGVFRTPITSVLIIFELTGGYELVLPLMLANMTAYGLAFRMRAHSIFEALLEQDGVHLPHSKAPPTHALEQLRVAAAMTTRLVTLPATIDVATAAERIASVRFSSFPVIDDDRGFLGLVSEARLRRMLAGGAADQAVQALIDRRTPVFPDQSLVDAVVQMDQHETRQLAVVDRHNPHRVVGMLTMSDIVRAQARAVRMDKDEDRFIAQHASEVQETLQR